MSEEVQILAIDVGGHRVKAGVVSVRGTRACLNEVFVETYPSVRQDAGIYKGLVPGSERVNGALELIRRLWKPTIRYIAIASTGVVDMTTGIVVRETSPTYEGTCWPSVLAGSGTVDLGVLVLIVNDAWCGAWWEFVGAGDDQPKGVAVRVTVGSGIGSGVLVGGALLRGAAAVAGEIAYVPFRPQNGVDGPHGRGCVEAYASATGIVREFVSLRSGTVHGAGHNVVIPSRGARLEDVRLALADGDACAAGAVQICGEALGTAIGVILNLLGPEVVAIGGSVVEALPRMVEVARDSARIIGLRAALLKCDIRKSRWRDPDVVLLGAASLAQREARPLQAYPEHTL